MYLDLCGSNWGPGLLVQQQDTAVLTEEHLRSVGSLSSGLQDLNEDQGRRLFDHKAAKNGRRKNLE